MEEVRQAFYSVKLLGHSEQKIRPRLYQNLQETTPNETLESLRTKLELDEIVRVKLATVSIGKGSH